jgi:hypothetical protein
MLPLKKVFRSVGLLKVFRNLDIYFTGHHTSFAQLSREKRVIKEQHRTLSEGVL